MKVILFSFFIFLGYLIGSIPPGAWLAKLYGYDITKHGSGNIGATNVGRLFGAAGFITVFFIDCLKAYGTLYALSYFNQSEISIVATAISLLIGNSYSIFLQGQGGKGVATSVGIFLAVAPSLLLIGFIIWFLLFFMTKTVGIASVGAYLTLLLFCIFIHPLTTPLKILIVFISVWGIFRHRENIQRYYAKGIK